MDWRERIVCDPEILAGKPAVKRTRLSVELILGWLAQGWTHEMVLESYPQLTRDDILAALAFAVEKIGEQSSRCWTAPPLERDGTLSSALPTARKVVR